MKKNFIFSKLNTSVILILSFTLILINQHIVKAYSSGYIWSSDSYISAMTSSTITSSSISSSSSSSATSSSNSEYTNNTSNPLNLDCGSCILIEQNTGKILYSYNSHEKLRPASVTKLMSILLIMDSIKSGKISYDTSIPCSENASKMGGSQIWLDTTETLTVDEMLKAICVVSANDCVVAMAEYIGGTEENFVKMMNDKAKSLGMNDTCFKNCHGIDEDGHVTSAYDISLMSKELLNKYPEITKYTTIWNDSLRDGKSELINTNKLVHNYQGCTGLKTGSTSLALYNLSASATRDNLSLIAVVMKAPSSSKRFSNASSLLDYGFANYEYQTLSTQGEIVESVGVEKGVNSTVNISYENTTGTLIEKNNAINIEKSISLNSNIEAPLYKGDYLGTASFSVNGEVISTVNLIANDDVKKLGFFSIFCKLIKIW